ncbi:putative alcohol oxidase [Camillea tinctor]|nr:putative alcohol oxidase [Camillea tinctor]
MISSELPSGLDEVDVIVVGGGTAGSIIAARLADADPQTTILVIEAGPDNYRTPTIIHPALYRANYGPQSNSSLTYVSKSEEQLDNRSVAVVTGSILGGGSSVNGAIYARAQQVDYDSWDTEGWSSKDLLPFLKKFETYHPPRSSNSHGLEGPIDVSDGTYSCPALRDDFISSLDEAGHPFVEDLQDLVSSNAVSAADRYVSPDTGERQDTAHTYLHPRLRSEGCENLHVLVQSQVTRIIFDGDNRASGVEFRTNPAFESGSSQKSTSTIKARRLVVVSTGSLSTPQLLERSGIGGRKTLEKAGVPVILDLPGVGHGYQDHHMVMATYNSSLTPGQSVDSVINGVMDMAQLLASEAKILSWNGIDASSKLRPTQDEIARFKPGLRKIWDQDFAHTPSKPLGSLVLIAGILGDPLAYPTERQYFSIGCYSPYPRSRGHVHITGPRIDDPLDFKSGFLTDPEGGDLQTLVWLYKKMSQVARKMKFQLGQVSPGPLFAEGSAAASMLKGAQSSGASDPAPEEVHYSPEDDRAIEQWVKENINSSHHPLGTCKMAPVEKMGVVDGSLSVHGIKGLKIADMSIAPSNVSANTVNTALMIGEKAADIFIKELGMEKL